MKTKTKPKVQWPGYLLDFEKDRLGRFFDATEAGLNFLAVVANEESGVDSETVNLAVYGITQSLSGMLADLREEVSHKALFNLQHGEVRAACEAVHAIERKAFDHALGGSAAA